jgi:hypothetical protein
MSKNQEKVKLKNKILWEVPQIQEDERILSEKHPFWDPIADKKLVDLQFKLFNLENKLTFMIILSDSGKTVKFHVKSCILSADGSKDFRICDFASNSNAKVDLYIPFVSFLSISCLEENREFYLKDSIFTIQIEVIILNSKILI